MSNSNELAYRLQIKVQQLEAMIELGRVLVGISSGKDVVRHLGLTLAGQLLLRSWMVVALREGRPPLVVGRAMVTAQVVSSETEVLRAEIGAWREPFRLNPGMAEQTASDGRLHQILTDLSVNAVIPLVSGVSVLGFVALGKKADGRELSDDEFELAHGMVRQAVVALEAAWGSEESDRWRDEVEARDTWSNLDILSRLVLVATARLGFETATTEIAVIDMVIDVLRDTDRVVPRDVLGAAVKRLIEAEVLSIGAGGRLLIDRPSLLQLPESRRPLSELARESSSRIGAYRIEGRIGSGGMGEVFQATNVHDGSPAAVKLLFPHGTDADVRRRFEREGSIVGTFSHPNIVRLLARGEHEGRLYLAMELIDGDNLERIVRKEALPADRALAGFAEIAAAIAELHRHEVVHRDIKTGNVMRSSSGRFVLLDFGLASALFSTAITRSKEVFGTLQYMAPEQLRGQKVGPAADIWSAGIVLFEMLTGRLPWRNTRLLLIPELLESRPEVFQSIEPIAGPEVAALISSMLKPDPGHRVPDGMALCSAIETLLEHWRPPSSPPLTLTGDVGRGSTNRNSVDTTVRVVALSSREVVPASARLDSLAADSES